MNNTLEHYLKKIDLINDQLLHTNIIYSKNILLEKRNEILQDIKMIQSVAKRLSDISNYITRILSNNFININNNILDPYPSSRDHAILRINSAKKKYINNNTVPVIEVENENDIPVNYLYYIKNIKQYAINIFGINIKGNISHLVNYGDKKIEKCKYGIDCKTIDKCNYYHDPYDFVKLGLDIPDNNIKNITNGNLIYNTKKKKSNMRLIGDINTLDNDLISISKDEYDRELLNREYMIINDLIMYIILHTKK